VFLNLVRNTSKNNSDWQSIFSLLTPTNQPASSPKTIACPPAQALSMAAHVAQPGPGTRGVLFNCRAGKLFVRLRSKAETWPASSAAAWPRFHDIYQPAGVRNYWATW